MFVMVTSSKKALCHRKFDMKIVDFKRDENNAVVAILEDDSEKTLSSDYVAQNKPQIGDEIIEDPAE